MHGATWQNMIAIRFAQKVSGIKTRAIVMSPTAWIMVSVFVMALAVGAYTFAGGKQEDAQAQSLPPLPTIIVYDGVVTVAGNPIGLEGLTLNAKVGDWVSESVVIGQGTHEQNGFENLNIDPPNAIIGSEIKFLLGGTVESETIGYYAHVEEDGTVCGTCPLRIFELRIVALDFPVRPVGVPVPTQQPTGPSATQPPSGTSIITLFNGQALTTQGLVPNGYQVFAVVGDKVRSNNVTILDGTYNLAVETDSTTYNGSSIKFFLIDKGDPTNPNKVLEAETPGVFMAGQPAETRLFFPMIAPTPTPEPPTATPVPPTPTPVPPTATPIPPTATPIPPTATPLPPTATPVPPTATPIPPTATPVPPTATPVPPTATPIPPTATPVPPTATPVPPTATPVPPTATPVPPTATPVPPTATPIPPTATPVPPTATTVPPTAELVAPSEDDGGEFNATIPLAILLAILIGAIAAYFLWNYNQRSRREEE